MRCLFAGVASASSSTGVHCFLCVRGCPFVFYGVGTRQWSSPSCEYFFFARNVKKTTFLNGSVVRRRLLL